MKLTSVFINSFRGIKDQELPLGDLITVVAGQNGTMKSTLLGIISQPFSMKGKSPFYKEKTFDNHSFESKFNEKFKWSSQFDIPGTHVWKINYSNSLGDNYIEVKSSIRKDPIKPDSIRIINTEGKKKGANYLRYPVIFLSLKRVTPFGEEHNEKVLTTLSEDEAIYFGEKHNEILSLLDPVQEVKNVMSKNKNSLLANTDYYDYSTNSAGQDNIGRIISAILSFKRLKEKYPDDYDGGLLFIDEADATLFPKSQEKLMDFLRKSASKLKLQIILTTHSFNIIKKTYEKEFKNNTRLLFLRKINKSIICDNDLTLEQVMAELNVNVIKEPTIEKIRVYCEDNEAYQMSKAILGAKQRNKLSFLKNVSLGCPNYENLIKKKVPEFLNSLIILDGDAKKKVKIKSKNVVYLPGDVGPDTLLYDYLKQLPDDDRVWEKEAGKYNKQKCFANYITRPLNREEFKSWIKEQMQLRNNNSTILYKRWRDDNIEKCDDFCNKVEDAIAFIRNNGNING